MHFTKLFSSILDSTIWQEPAHTKLTWITMLAMVDRHGEVHASIPGLAARTGVSIQECEEALASFQTPDPYSRTKDYEGKRVKVIDGGWALLNHGKYCALLNAEERREYNRRKQSEYRAKDKANALSMTVNDTNTQAATNVSNAHIVDVDVDVDVEKELPEPTVPPIIAAWNLCGCFPKVSNLGAKRKAIFSARMRDPFFKCHALQAIQLISKSDFCTGKNDRGWVATINWFLRPGKVEEIIEGAFTNRRGNQKTATDNAIKPGEYKNLVFDPNTPENQ